MSILAVVSSKLQPLVLPQASTPLSLKATAGLRLLPGDKADKILEAVTSHLKKLPFSISEGAVSVMGGESAMIVYHGACGIDSSPLELPLPVGGIGWYVFSASTVLPPP